MTKKQTKKKVAKKVVKKAKTEKLKAPAKVEESTESKEPAEKCLDEVEILKLNANHSEQAEQTLLMQLTQKDIALIEGQKNILKQKVTIMDYEIQRLNEKVKTNKQKLEQLKEKHRKFIEELKNKHGIEGAFGYDPDTGILKED
jgi:hypothetical protein